MAAKPDVDGWRCCTAAHLVGAEGVGEHVAAARSQHVHLLTHVVFQLLKLALGPADLRLDLGTDKTRG